MCAAGIDINIFKPHSTRAASSSAAFARRLPMATILKTVGWKSDSVFRKFYNKPVVVDGNFSIKVLAKYDKL